MNLITATQSLQLAANGRAAERDPDFDPLPVVRLFTPDAAATWLLAWTDTEDADIAFGLCDLGMGFPELGTVRLSELQAIRGQLGLPVERDLHWSPTKPLSAYSRAALTAQRIVEP